MINPLGNLQGLLPLAPEEGLEPPRFRTWLTARRIYQFHHSGMLTSKLMRRGVVIQKITLSASAR